MRKRLLLLGAGIILTFFVVNLFGLAEVAAALARANPAFVAGTAGLQLAALTLYAARLRAIGGGFISFAKALRVTLAGGFVSLITPIAKIGGEPLKMYMIRDNYGGSKAAAVVVADDVVDALVNILLVGASVAFLVPIFVPSMIATFAIFLAVASGLLAIAVKLFLSPTLLKRIVDWFLDKISKHPDKKADHVGMFYESFCSLLLKKPAKLAAVINITFLIKLAEFAVIWLSFAAIGAALPWHAIILMWSIILVFLFVPWLPGSLGLVELGAASALVALGIPSAVAAGGILINRFASFWLVLAAGLVALTVARKHGELPGAFYVDHEKV